MKRQRELAKQQEAKQKNLRRQTRSAQKKEAKQNGTPLDTNDGTTINDWFGPLPPSGNK
jgi:hypothetical protein